MKKVLILTAGFGEGHNAAARNLAAAIEAFRRHGNVSMHLRTTEELVALASPWRPTTIRSLPEWLGVPDMFTPEELLGQGGSMAGAFFER